MPGTRLQVPAPAAIHDRSGGSFPPVKSTTRVEFGASLHVLALVAVNVEVEARPAPASATVGRFVGLGIPETHVGRHD